jgi:hypothetical protein
MKDARDAVHSLRAFSHRDRPSYAKARPDLNRAVVTGWSAKEEWGEESTGLGFGADM